MTYEDEGGHPTNQEEQIEEATQRVESQLESMGNTIRELLEALERQCDNMAFVLSHAPMPDQWYDKFSEELVQDRGAIKRAS